MNKQKQIFGIVLVTTILFLSMVSVSGLEASQEVSGWTAFWNNLFHSQGTYSVVGTNQGCGINGNPNYEWQVASGKKLDGSEGVLAGTRPSSIPANSIIDIFTNGWTAFLEVKNFNTYGYCGTGPCNVQLYVCPHPEPTSQADCTSWGLGTYNPVSCDIWPDRYTSSGTPITAYRCPTETGIPYYTSSYRYCSVATAHKCYYKPDGATTCNYNSYIGVSSCSEVGSPLGFYNGKPLFETQSACDASTSCTNQCSPGTKQCSGSGFQTCVLQSTGCYGWSSVTDCASGETCSNGICSTTSCVPDNSCAADTCSGSTCLNNCGTVIQGTKDCSTVIDRLSSNLEVVSIEVPDSPSSAASYPSLTKQFKVTLKNTGSISETFNVEAGFYTYEYAKDIAKLPSNNIFSFLFSTIDNAPNCVGNEGFIKTKQVTIAAGDTQEIVIQQAPLFAYMTLPRGEYELKGIQLTSYLGVYKDCCQKIVGFEGCAENTGGFLKDKNGREIYKVNWDYKSPDTIAPNSENILCSDGSVYGNLNYKIIAPDVITISRDYKDCISYEFYNINGTLDVNATNAYNNNVTLGSAKKLSYTKEEIKTMTNNDLLAISCLSNSECVAFNENYSTSCVSLKQLREEGIISQSQQDSFFSNAKSVLKTGTYVTVGSGALCVGLALTNLIPGIQGLSVPATIGSCSALAAVIGLTSGTIQAAYFDIRDNDELVSKLRASDDSSVGFCVATEESAFSKYTSWAAFFKITGDKGTDGLLIIFGVLVIIGILFRR